MLKAEVAGIGFPEKGTPQGGVISPLLSNIVLNELDWWVHSQWEGFETKRPYNSQPGKYKSLRKFTRLKECYIVRYADDFKIFCRTLSDARKMFAATEMWLKEQLGLSVSAEKSRIVNLKKNTSDFLGFTLKVRPKGKKYVVTSHVGDKALRRVKDEGKQWVRRIQHSANKVDMAQIRRNLAFNPFDGTKNRGMYPHMTHNVKYEDSLRNKLLPNKGLFAPRCVIDGFLANESHRLYPHQSWGINRNPNAWLTCEFGRAVDIDCVRLAIRGEFPHDNYWVQATLRCSDKSEEIIHLQKTLDIQSFPLTRHGITSLTLCELMMSDEPSPFPALSLLEIYGKDANYWILSKSYHHIRLL